jgi:hypothetical protein
VFWGTVNSIAPKILFGILLFLYEINCMKLAGVASGPCLPWTCDHHGFLHISLSDVASKRDGNGFQLRNNKHFMNLFS